MADEKGQAGVTIGSFNLNSTSSSRSVEAVNSVVKSKSELEAKGYVIDTKGPSAGSDGRFNVYVYPAEAGHKIGDRNNPKEAVHTFSVKYESGGHPVSKTAIAESFANNLGEFSQSVKQQKGYDPHQRVRDMEAKGQAQIGQEKSQGTYAASDKASMGSLSEQGGQAKQASAEVSKPPQEAPGKSMAM